MVENAILPPAAAPPYGPAMDARVAVLEEIARGTKELLTRMDMRMARLEDRQLSDFRWLFGLGLAATAFLLAADGGLFALIAHGLRWF